MASWYKRHRLGLTTNATIVREVLWHNIFTLFVELMAVVKHCIHEWLKKNVRRFTRSTTEIAMQTGNHTPSTSHGTCTTATQTSTTNTAPTPDGVHSEASVKTPILAGSGFQTDINTPASDPIYHDVNSYEASTANHQGIGDAAMDVLPDDELWGDAVNSKLALLTYLNVCHVIYSEQTAQNVTTCACIHLLHACYNSICYAS